MSQCPFDFKKIAEIKNILNNHHYKVRPENERIPNEIRGNFIGEIYAQLIRMRDDEPRESLKQALVETLNMLTTNRVEEATRHVILSLAPELDSVEKLNQFLLAVPICVIGYFLGFRQHQWLQLITDVEHFSRSIVIVKPPLDNIADKIAASKNIYSQIEQQKGFLFTEFSNNYAVEHADSTHRIISNLMGLLFQVSDSTTSLLGLTLIEYNKNSGQEYHQIMEHVLASMPPIKNTKRFILEHGKITNVIVPLIAEAVTLPFGYGKHSCPGEHIAKAITLTTIDFIIQNRTEMDLFSQYYWKDLPNANYPLFYKNNKES